MMLVAHELGIGSVMANIYEIDQARALLSFLLSDVLLGDLVRLSGRSGRIHASTQVGRQALSDNVVHWERW